MPYSASSASATSTRSALPARSPIPLTVPCTQVAPACTAATAAAVASPKSSWPCQWTGTSWSSRSTTSPTRNAAASGVAIPSVSTTTTSFAPASTAVSYAASDELEVGAASSRRRRTRRGCPRAAANETADADPLEHRLARDAERGELAVRDRALDHRRAARRARRAPRRRPARRARSPRSRPRGRPRGSARSRARRPRTRAGSRPRCDRRRRATSALAISSFSLWARARRRRSARRRAASCRTARPSRAAAARAPSRSGRPSRPSSGRASRLDYPIRERRELLRAVVGDRGSCPRRGARRRLPYSILARLQAPCPAAISPPPAWCAYGGSCARAPTPWQIGCDGWPGKPMRVDPRADAAVELGEARARAREARSRPRTRASSPLRARGTAG